MGCFMREDESTKRLIARRNMAMLQRANSPEQLWETMFNLLPEQNATRLHDQFKQMGIIEHETKICSLHSDDNWSKLTENGTRPYLVIGNSNYGLFGTVDGKANQTFDYTGKLPKDQDIYEDKLNQSCVMIAFPESGITKWSVTEEV